jgi:hypothetical protein
MEATVVIDILLGALMLVMGFILKRIFQLFDKLMEEDKLLHSRITDLSTESVSRQEMLGAIDRVLSRIDKMEERLMSK